MKSMSTFNVRIIPYLKKCQFVRLLALVVFLFTSALAHALSSGITYHGRLVEPDGVTPVSGVVQFKIQIRTPDSSNCLLYEEWQSVDLGGTNGVFALTINDGTATYTNPASLPLDTVFANRGTYTFTSGCSGSNTYTPSIGDGRNLKVTFQGPGMATEEQMPLQTLNFAPFAIEAKQISGFQASNLLRFAKSDGTLVNTSPLNDVEYAALVDLVDGNSTLYAKNGNATTGTPIFTKAGSISSATPGDMWLDTTTAHGYVLKINTDDGVQEIPMSASGSFLSAVAAGSGITVSTTGSTATVGIGGSAVVNGMLANGAVTSAKIAAGTIVGANLDAGIVIATSGTVSAAGLSSRILTLSNSQSPVDSTHNEVSLLAPGNAFTGYSLTLPTAVGSNGQVLSTDASGNLSWINASSGSVTSITAAATAGNPLVVLGTSAPTIDLPKADLTHNGYLSMGDYSSFVNKVSSTLASAHIFVGNASNVATDVAVSGDITMSNAGLTKVVAIQGVGVGTSAPSSAGQLLRYDGSNYNAGFLSMADIRSTTMPGLTIFPTSSCAASKALSWNSLIDQFTCQDIAISASQVSGLGTAAYLNVGIGSNSVVQLDGSSKLPAVDGSQLTNLNASALASGTVPLARLPLSATFWQDAGGGKIDYAGGAVGVGTSTPTGILQVAAGTTGVYTTTTDFANGTTGSGTILKTGAPTGDTFSSLQAFSAGNTTQNNLILQAAGGNVGIGTTNPNYKLDVNGPVNATALKINGVDVATSGGAGGGIASTTNLTFNTDTDNMGSDGGFNFQARGSNLFNLSNIGDAVFASTTASSSSTTGALKIGGGLGVVGDVFAGASINAATSLNAATSVSAATSITAGTTLTAPQIYGVTTASGNLKIDGTSNAAKGNVLLATAGGSVGVGTSAPTALLTLGAGTSAAGTAPFKLIAGTNLTTPEAGAVEYDGTNLYYTDGTAARHTIASSTASSSVGALSSLTAATATNTIDNLNFAQAWNWATATTQTPLTMNANALTSGSLLSLASSSAALNSTNGLLNVANTGASTTGMVARIQSNSTAGSGLTVLANGKVGVGTVNPGQALDVNGAANISAGVITPKLYPAVDGTSAVQIMKADGSTSILTVDTTNSRVGIGTTAPTAALHLAAGAAAAGSAPLKFTPGTNLTSPENGAMEYDGINYYLTAGGTRNQISFTGGAGGGSSSTTSLTYNTNSDGVGADGGFNFQANGTNLFSLANNGDAVLASTTASTSSTTGSLKVSGGLGVAGDIFAGSTVNGTTLNAATSVVSPQIYGSTLASGNIKIDGTSNATKGNVLLATAGGKVGIGTTNPGQALDVTGAINASTGVIAPKLYPAADGTNAVQITKADGSTNILTVDTTDSRVGIGMTAPTARLNIAAGTAAAGTAPLKLTAGTNLATPEAGAVEYDGTNLYYTDGTAARHTIASSTAASSVGALSSLTAATATNTIDSLNFAQTWNWSTASTQTPLSMNANALTTGSLLSLASSNAALNSTNGLLNVANTGVSTTGMVARIQSNSATGSGLTVLASGNVGIGTTSPQRALDIASTSAAAGLLRLQNTSSTGYSSTLFVDNLGTTQGSAGYANTGAANYAGTVHFGSAASTSTPVTLIANGVEAMRIASGGNIGIGTTTPTAKLAIAAGTAAAGTAPLKLTAGTNLTTPEAGAVEYDGTNLYYTDGTAARHTIASSTAASSVGALSSLTAATAVNTIDSLNFAQTWNWSTATTQTAHVMNANALTTGGLLTLASSSASLNSTNGLLNVANTGASTTGMVARIQSNSALASGLTVLANGKVGIGTTAPAQSLDVTGAVNVSIGVITPKLYPSADGTNAVQITKADGSTNILTVDTTNSRVGIGTTTPTAVLALKAGTATAGTAPLKLTAGTNLTTPESGAIEYDGTNLYYTDGTAARHALLATGGSSAGALSGLTAATAVNTIDSLNFAQTWNWSTATTQTPLSLNANALTTGSLLSLASSNATLNSTNGLLNVANTGASTTGMVARIQSSSAAQSGMSVLANGNVGIGTTAPSAALDVVGNTGGYGIAAGFASATSGTGSVTLGSLGTGGGFVQGFNSSSSWGSVALNPNGGNVGIGTSTPSAKLNIAAGTTAAGSAPLKFTSGPVMTTPENGAVEYDGTSLFYTDSSGTRRTLASSGGAAPGQSTTTALTFNTNSDGAGNDGGFNFQANGANLLTIANNGDSAFLSTTASTSPTTGSVKTAGGLGVAGDIFAGATVNAATYLMSPQIYGSTLASGNIKIDGTSNTTKGNVLLATAGGGVGIGTSTPLSKLDVSGGMSVGTYAGVSAAPTNTLIVGGSVGIGTTLPSAKLNIAAGTAAAGTAPLKFTAGTNLTTPETGAIEFDGTNLYYTDGTSVRRTVANTSTVGSLSLLTAATAINTIDSLNFAQTWNWSTATTQTPLSMNANALTTGSLLSLASSSASLNSANGLLNVANTSASTTGTVARIQSNSTAGSGLTVLANGKVGIGTTAPAQALDVNGAINASAGVITPKLYPATDGTSAVQITKADGSTNIVTVDTTNSRVGIGTTVPTAKLNIAAGTTSAGSAPLKFTSGPVMTTPENGAVEYDGTSLFYTDSSGTRRTLASSGGAAPGQSTTTALTFNTNSDGTGADGGFNFQANGTNLLTLANNGDAAFTSTTASTSTSTGSVKVAGGLGVAGSVNANIFAAANGLATAPSYTFINDLTSGMWMPSVGNVALSSNNTERMRITSTGNIGIGTTGPIDPLSIGPTPSPSATHALVNLSNTPLVGASASGTYLSANPPAAVADFINYQVAGATKFSVDKNGKLTGDGSGLTGVVAGSATFSSLTAAIAVNTIDSLNFAQTWNWSTATTQTPLTMNANALTTGSLLSLVSSNATLNSTNGLLSVANTSASTTGMVARIQSNSTAGSGLAVLANGNIGIGTSAPGYKLEVAGDAKTSSSFIGGAGIVSYPGIQVGGAGAGFFSPTGNILAVSTNSAERMRVLSTGEVGIGTTAPTSALTVAGNITSDADSTRDVGTITNRMNNLYARSVSGGANNLSLTSSAYVVLQTAGLTRVTVDNTGKVGIGTTAPTASLNLAAGAATAGTAPLKLTAGTNLTTPEAGAIEYDGTNLYYTDGTATRRTIASSTATSTVGSLSSITAATAVNTIDSLNFAQTWNWSTATTQTPLSMNANALTTGSMLSLASSNASLNSTNGLLNVANTGASTTGMVARIQSNSTAGSGLTVLANGNIGVGATSPFTALSNYGAASNDSSSVGPHPSALLWSTSASSLGYIAEFENRNAAAGNYNGLLVKTAATDSGSYIARFESGGINRVTVRSDGNVGIGVTAPSAKLNIVAGTATAGTAPLKLTAGTNLTTPEAGAIEYDGTNLYYTDGTAARHALLATGGSSAGALSGLTAATAVNTIDSLNFAQTWNWSTATTQTGHVMNANALTTGGLLTLSSSSASLNSAAGLLNVANTGASTNGMVARIQSNSTAGSGLTVLASGNVGIGTTAPTAALMLKAGTATVGTAPLKLTAGTNLTTPESGAIEFDGTSLYYTDSSAARHALLATGGASSGALSGLTAATATNTIDSLNFAQTWNWSTATTQTPLTMNANALTTGSMLSLASSNATLNSTNGLLNVANTGASTTGMVARIQSNSTAGSGLTVLANGNAGVGTVSPNGKFSVASADTGAGVTGLGSSWSGYSVFGPNAGTSGGSLGFGYSTTDDIANIAAVAPGTAWKPLRIISGGMMFNTTNSGEAMRITATGNLGIGTTAPVSKLDVAGGVSLGSYAGVSAAPSNSMIISGNVGIGTTAPTAKLNIAAGTATAGTSPLKLTAGVNLTTPEAGAVEYDGTNLYYTDGTATRRTIASSTATSTVGSLSSLTAATAVNTIDSLNFAQTWNWSTATTQIAHVMNANALTTGGLLTLASSSASLNSTNGLLNVANTGASTTGMVARIQSSSAPQSGLTVLANGNVGIGATAPGYQLQVGSVLAANANAAALPGEVRLTGYSGGVSYLGARDDSGSNSLDLQFRTQNAGTVNSVLRLTAGGNVGIGTTAPTAKLNIAAGTATAGTAPLKLTAGTNLTTPEAGAIEYDGTSLYYTDNSAARHALLATGGAASGALSGLTAATATNTIDSLNFAQTWNWSTSTTQTPLTINANALTGGSILTLVSSNASLWSANGLLNVANTGGSTNGVIARFQSNSTAGSGLTVLASSNVGIGTSAPSAKLNIAAGTASVGTAPLKLTAGTNLTTPEAGAVEYDGTNLYYTDGTATRRTIASTGGAGGNPLSGLTAATATNTIDSLNFAQTWNWSTATTQTAQVMNANALTTGGLLTLASSSASLNSTNGLLNVANTSASTTGMVARIQSNSTAGSGVSVLANGNVGIGTTAPGNLLSVSNAGSTNSQIQFTNYVGAKGGYLFYNSNVATFGANTEYASGAATARGASPTSANFGQGVIQFNTDSGLTAGNTFTPTERMRIDSSGNVGIGTTAPSTALSVFGSAITFMNSVGSGTASLYNDGNIHLVGDSTSGGGVQLSGAGGVAMRNSANGASLSLFSTTAGNSYINSTGGNVGIGTTAPNYPLELDAASANMSLISTTAGSLTYLRLNNGINTKGFLEVESGSSNSWTNSILNAMVVGNKSAYPLQFATSGAVGMTMDTAGNVGIGTTAPAQKLDVYGNIAINGVSICTSSGCTSSSDKTLKEGIKPLQNSLDKVLKLQGVEYDYKDKAKFTDKHQIGVIAQDVEKVYPEVVLKDSKTGLRSVAYDHLVAPLIEAIKALYGRIVSVESHQTLQDRDIASVKAANEKLEAKAIQLESQNAQIKADSESKAEQLKADAAAKAVQIKQLEKENAAKAKELDAMKAYLCAKDPAAPICK